MGDDWVVTTYYELAEDAGWISAFWAPETLFAKRFAELSRGDMIEIACGHGRHAAQIVDSAKSLLLLDINQSNIDVCKQRFGGRPNVRCAVNDGFTLGDAPDESADSVYSYDAMVHFEPDVVGSYLADIMRVLRPRGRALLHHSNYSGNPGERYTNNPHYRNYMSTALFQHFAGRAGLTILAQNVFDWAGVPKIDALTLLERPA